MDGSMEEKIQQLASYKEHLVVVQEALRETNPSDPEHGKLVEAKKNLEDVIKLLEDVCSFDEGARAAPEASASVGQPQKNELIGRTVEVCLNKAWYNAEVFSVRRDDRGVERCVLTIFGHKERREVKLSEIKKLGIAPPTMCMPGTKCQAIYVQDGLWYDCTIEEQTEKGYIVIYAEGSKEEVKFDQVRLKSHNTSVHAKVIKGDQKKKPVKEIITTGGYRIPENLMIKPEDTDEVRESKKRKINHLKKIQKDERSEVQAVQKQNSWQKFNQRSGPSTSGFKKSGLRKESIFASSTEGKIGVISGKQATAGLK